MRAHRFNQLILEPGYRRSLKLMGQPRNAFLVAGAAQPEDRQPAEIHTNAHCVDPECDRITGPIGTVPELEQQRDVLLDLAIRIFLGVSHRASAKNLRLQWIAIELT